MLIFSVNKAGVGDLSASAAGLIWIGSSGRVYGASQKGPLSDVSFLLGRVRFSEFSRPGKNDENCSIYLQNNGLH